MKSSKIFYVYAGALFVLLLLTNIVSTSALFRAVDKENGFKGNPESRLAPMLTTLNDQMKSAKTPDDLKKAFRNFESSAGLGGGSDIAEEVHKIYAPLVAHYANKPKEAESRHQLLKKRDFLEMSVNAYRKEIPSGDLRVRSHLLNMVFETQSSFLNESAETELVYVKRAREHIAALHQLAAGNRDQAQAYRMNNLDSAFALYEKSFTMGKDWSDARNELLAKTEKASAELAKNAKKISEGGAEDSRRDFLGTTIFFAAALLVCIALLYFGGKHISLRFEHKASILARYLREFAAERENPALAKEVSALGEDEEWGGLLTKVKEAEQRFVASTSTQLALSRALTLPFIVFQRDRGALYWNESAAGLLGLPADHEKTVALDEIINTDKISLQDGDASMIVEMVRNSFSTPKDDTFEFLCVRGEEKIPVELVSCPVNSGPLAGGKVYVFREIRNEMARVESMVAKQTGILQDIVHKITHGYPCEFTAAQNSAPAVKAMAGDLELMKMKVDERETLWQSETGALLDQISRQKEILTRLSEEISTIRRSSGDLAELFVKIYDLEEGVADEVNIMERNLSRWVETRKRMQAIVSSQSAALGKVKGYEESMRAAVEGIKDVLRGLIEDFRKLQEFKEEARLQAINLSFAPQGTVPPAYADSARAYAKSLSDFCERIQGLADKLQGLVHRHPGGALYAQLDGLIVDEEVMEWLREEQTKLSEAVQRWKRSEAELLEGSGKAMQILNDVKTNGAVADQLGETSLLINEQAKENLSRWL